MKPSWDTAPEWAQFLAMDFDGCWCWFAQAPKISRRLRMWANRSGTVWKKATDENPPAWDKSVERRPS